MGTGYSANGAYPGVPSTGNNQYDYADGRSYPGVGHLASNYQIRRFPNGNFGYQFGDQYAPPPNVPGVPPPVPTSAGFNNSNYGPVNIPNVPGVPPPVPTSAGFNNSNYGPVNITNVNFGLSGNEAVASHVPDPPVSLSIDIDHQRGPSKNSDPKIHPQSVDSNNQQNANSFAANSTVNVSDVRPPRGPAVTESNSGNQSVGVGKCLFFEIFLCLNFI